MKKQPSFQQICQKLKLNHKQSLFLKNYIQTLMTHLLESLKEDNLEELEKIDQAIDQVQSQ